MPASLIRKTNHAIAPQFIERWSPRSFTDEKIPHDTLFTFFEAARWAPSAANRQPWRFIYSLHDSASWSNFLNLLTDNNRAWAYRAAALVVIVSESSAPARDTGVATPSHSHAFDAGAAWAHLALQASLSGWATHGIGGFDRDKARELLSIPPQFAIQAAVAIGRRGSKEELSGELRQRESPNGRLPLQQIIFADCFAE
jgi:nitroreductase